MTTRPLFFLPPLAAATTLFALAWSVGAQAAWPEKPIRIVIPYAAGGSADNALRKMAPLLQGRLGQPIVIENRAGAAGNIGAHEVARAAADGYTLLLGATNNFAINQFVYANMGFDPRQAFAPITRVLDVPSVLFTNSAVPASTYAEFARYAASHRGDLNYGSPGLGTAPHLSGFALSESLGADMRHIAYKGAPPAMMGLVANDIQMFLGSYSAMSAQLAAGRVRALAVMANARLPALPEVPTSREAGVPDVVLSNWWGLAAPAGTPAPVIERLASEFRTALSDPGVKSYFDAQGFIAGGNTPAAFAGQIESEARIWRDIVARSKTKLD
ncbi:MAG: ABC transporter substrate-binding protein [Bordetella sp. SCN 67-23]|nr:tripartite tricarboxylate transporter substrate binding protein [Burkholderiales bacterium]ODS69985.1 MAG: ABC transporter substrate-binding protein [Bordetella sp. SCN 67-23]ODU91662.1 MAG: ABC transporter substrate-binding protein [Bordetella sp. SCN 68-11]OJW85985.1 MAG: ABC transporter substrate-binding protein [Burkholderiales bacterium 67-32]